MVTWAPLWRCVTIAGPAAYSILNSSYNIDDVQVHTQRRDSPWPSPTRRVLDATSASRQAYYEHLQAVRDRGDWEAWLAFFLRGAIAVAGEATDTARRVLLLREDHRAAITTGLGRAAGNGHKVLESLFDRPIVSVKDVEQLTGTTYAAANNLVARLANLGILSEMTGYARNRRFRYAPYIALFGDDGGAAREGGVSQYDVGCPECCALP